jgi:ATP-dependent DNA helicase RecG
VRLLELLDQLRTLDEHSRLEAKKASRLGDSILETVCAFANEPGLHGGTILLGVERLNEGMLFPDYVVTGVSDPDKLQADLVSQCRSVFNIPISVSVTAEHHDGKTVLIVDVPEAAPGAKPVHFLRKPLPGSAFRRLGSADVKCTGDDLALLYQQRTTTPFDATVIEGSGLDDVDPDAITLYRTTRARSNPNAEELGLGDADLLRALRCLDITATGPSLTVAGLVLFGRARAQRRLLPLLRLDYVRVPGREWVPDAGERFATTLDMRGPLLTLLARAQAAIVDDLPRAFHLPEGTMQRQDEPRLPLRVIREAVVNATMHRSYRSQQPAQIIRYANRLEVRNPGYSLKALERLGEPGSEPRNPTIAAVLHELNFAETKGTGIRTMQTEMRQAGLSPPTFVSSREADNFTATFLFHHFLDAADVAWLGRFKTHDLSDDMLKALVFVRERGLINNPVYRDLTQRHAADATRDLRRLCELDILRPEGNTTSRIYLPGPVMARAEVEATGEGRMPDKPVTMHDSGAGMHGKADTMPDSGLPNLPEHLRALVSLLGRRTDPEMMHAVVERLCAWRPLSVGQLADLLGRTETYTRVVVGAMVKDGRLERTRPDAPRHPEQAYRAAPRQGGAA